MHRKIQYHIAWLQQDNYKSFYLALLRVGICCWLLKEVAINLSSMEMLYGHDRFVVGKTNFLRRLPGGMEFVKNCYGWFIAVYVAILLLYIAGIGRWFTAVLVFFLVNTLQHMNMLIVNGGDMMARLILFYLAFANSYQYFVFFKENAAPQKERRYTNLLSNLAAFSIMLHLCLAYLSSGIIKILDPYWWRGEALYYTLQLERFTGTPLNLWMTSHRWVSMIATYLSLAFELLFPILVWFKRIRKYILLIGVIFHLGIYIFMMIYAFQVVFLLIYGLFIPNQRWLNFAEKVKRKLPGRLWPNHQAPPIP